MTFFKFIDMPTMLIHINIPRTFWNTVSLRLYKVGESHTHTMHTT